MDPSESIFAGLHPAASCSPAVLGCFTEAAFVSLARFHSPSTTRGEIRWSTEEGPLELEWAPPTPAQLASHANQIDATEQGAYAVAIGAVQEVGGYEVIGRAHHASGADLLMLPDGGSEDDLVRLEVSGTCDHSEVPRRLQSKMDQLGRGDLHRPGVAAVVSFDRLRVCVAEDPE